MRIKWNLVWSFYGTIAIPILYLVTLLIAFKYGNSFQATQTVVFLGIFIAAFGLILWIASYIDLGKSFGVLPKKAKKVNKGVYKYFNHPMYAAIWCTFFGLGLANKSLQGLFFLNLVLLTILIIRAKLEEKLLFD